MSDPAVPRPSAVVVPVRQGQDGIQVLLLQRSHASRFMPGTWVFPGGTVAPADSSVSSRGGQEAARRMDVPDARERMVAALRELFEEAGLATGFYLSAAQRTLLVGGAASFGALCREWGQVLDLDPLLPWAHWITPVEEPLRFDTWFFLLVVDAGTNALHDQQETIASGWFSPSAVLADSAAGGMQLSPPVFRTLEELDGFPRLDALRVAAQMRPLPPILPRWRDLPGGQILFLLPGDREVPAPLPVDGPTRILWDGRCFTSVEDTAC